MVNMVNHGEMNILICIHIDAEPPRHAGIPDIEKANELARMITVNSLNLNPVLYTQKVTIANSPMNGHVHIL